LDSTWATIPGSVPLTPAVRASALGFLLAAAPAAGGLAAPALSRVRDVRELSSQDAGRALPVSLRAVVTFYNFQPDWHPLFVHDESGGIYVELVEQPDLGLRAGDVVEIQGQTGPGMFAPIVDRPQIRVVGRTDLPAAKARSIHELLEGAWDSQWVEADGVVRRVRSSGANFVVLELGSQGRSFRALVREPGAEVPTHLMDARVRVRGACGTFFTQKRQIVGVQLLVPGMSQVTVVERGPADPFAQPARPVANLLQFSAVGRDQHRLRVRGTVTQRVGEDSFFLQEGGAGLLVGSNEPVADLRPGDVVDVVGFPELGEYSPRLQNSQVRRVQAGTAAEPLLVTAATLFGGEHDALPVSVQGVLLNQTREPPGFVLLMKAEDHTFEARVAEGDGLALRTGSVLRVSGICRVQAGPRNRVEGFRLLVASPAQIHVLREAPWWTLRHTAATIGALVALMLGGFGWNLSLRRRVQHALARVKVLSGLLPMCAWCRKIRDDRGYWSLVETYLQDHANAQVTHGICPECQARLVAERERQKADAVGPP
jgi:hypothetical protein